MCTGRVITSLRNEAGNSQPLVQHIAVVTITAVARAAALGLFYCVDFAVGWRAYSQVQHCAQQSVSSVDRSGNSAGISQHVVSNRNVLSARVGCASVCQAIQLVLYF